MGARRCRADFCLLLWGVSVTSCSASGSASSLSPCWDPVSPISSRKNLNLDKKRCQTTYQPADRKRKSDFEYKLHDLDYKNVQGRSTKRRLSQCNYADTHAIALALYGATILMYCFISIKHIYSPLGQLKNIKTHTNAKNIILKNQQRGSNKTVKTGDRTQQKPKRMTQEEKNMLMLYVKGKK